MKASIDRIFDLCLKYLCTPEHPNDVLRAEVLSLHENLQEYVSAMFTFAELEELYSGMVRVRESLSRRIKHVQSMEKMLDALHGLISSPGETCPLKEHTGAVCSGEEECGECPMMRGPVVFKAEIDRLQQNEKFLEAICEKLQKQSTSLEIAVMLNA